MSTTAFESPFLDQELLVEGDAGEWEPRATALAGESPFVGALETEATASEDDEEGEEREEETEKDQDEAAAPLGEDESEAQGSWEELEEPQLLT